MNESQVSASDTDPAEEPLGSPAKRLWLIGCSIALVGATIVIGVALVLKMVGVL